MKLVSILFIILYFQKKEVILLREDQVALHDLRNEHEKMKTTAAEAKTSLGRLAELEALVVQLQKTLEQERKEKSHLIYEKDFLSQKKEEVGHSILVYCIT